jgi:hypothetical protein
MLRENPFLAWYLGQIVKAAVAAMLNVTDQPDHNPAMPLDEVMV